MLAARIVAVIIHRTRFDLLNVPWCMENMHSKKRNPPKAVDGRFSKQASSLERSETKMLFSCPWCLHVETHSQIVRGKKKKLSSAMRNGVLESLSKPSLRADWVQTQCSGADVVMEGCTPISVLEKPYTLRRSWSRRKKGRLSNRSDSHPALVTDEAK